MSDFSAGLALLLTWKARLAAEAAGGYGSL